MKLFYISDNVDTKIGMRLAGIEGKVVHSKIELNDTLKKACNDDSIGIILISQKLATDFADVIYEAKQKQKIPLIVKIPDRHGNSKISETIEEYIQKSVGLKFWFYSIYCLFYLI